MTCNCSRAFHDATCNAQRMPQSFRCHVIQGPKRLKVVRLTWQRLNQLGGNWLIPFTDITKHGKLVRALLAFRPEAHSQVGSSCSEAPSGERRTNMAEFSEHEGPCKEAMGHYAFRLSGR